MTSPSSHAWCSTRHATRSTARSAALQRSSEAINTRGRPIPDTLGARLHAASTLSLNCIRLAHPPGGLHEPLLDHADESDTMARDSPCLGPIGVFQFS